MSKRKKRTYTPEQRADAVKMARELGNMSEVARRLDLTPSVLRIWVQRADIEDGNGPKGALNASERAELTELRRRNRQLEMEQRFLKKAAAFFAKESDTN